MASNSNNSLAHAILNVYGHMYCDVLTNDDGNNQNSTKTKHSGIVPVFQNHNLETKNGERLFKSAVMAGE